MTTFVTITVLAALLLSRAEGARRGSSLTSSEIYAPFAGNEDSPRFRPTYNYNPDALTTYRLKPRPETQESIPLQFQAKNSDSDSLRRYTPFDQANPEEEALFLKPIGNRPYSPTVIEVPLYIDMRSIISRHYQTCTELEEWRRVAHYRYCNNTVSSVWARGLCHDKDLLVLSGAANECWNGLERLISPLGVFVDIPSNRNYAQRVNNFNREAMDTKGRFRRETNSTFNDGLENGNEKKGNQGWTPFNYNPETNNFEDGNIWNSALLAKETITRVVNDKRTRQGELFTKELFKKSHEEGFKGIKKPMDNVTSIFDSEKFTSRAENVKDSFWLRSVISEVSGILDHSTAVVDGLTHLLKGDLSPTLMSPQYFRSTLTMALRESQKFEIHAIDSDPVALWGQKKDIFFNEDEAYFLVVLKVPAQRKKISCSMFRLQETPFSIGGGLSVVLERPYSSIIEFCGSKESESPPLPTLMSAADFQECTQDGKQYTCPKAPSLVRDSPLVDQCLHGLMLNNENLISEHCKLKLYNGGSLSLLIEQGVHFLHYREKLAGRIACNHHDSQVYIREKGNHILELPVGCSFYGDGLIDIETTYGDAAYIPKMSRLKMGTNIEIISGQLKKYLNYLINDRFALHTGMSINELKEASASRSPHIPLMKGNGEHDTFFVVWLAFVTVLAVFPWINKLRRKLCNMNKENVTDSEQEDSPV